MESNLTDRQYHSFSNISRSDTPKFAQNVTFSETSQADAFGRLRVSQTDSIFDNYEIQAKKTLFWSENSVGTTVCTHVANQSAVQFSTSMTSGNKVTRSSKKLSLYTPGTSLQVLCTGVMGEGAIGHSQRIGFFDSQNGIFCEMKDQVMGFVIRSYTTGSAANNRIDQDDWNVDRMDGTGPSEIELDFTKAQIFWFDMEWLGAGRVRCGFIHNGNTYVAHEFYHSNLINKVYMTTPLLPVTYEIENTTALSTALTDFRQICSSIQREGGESTAHKHHNVNNAITPISVTSTTAIPILSLKLQSAYVGKGMIKPDVIDCMSTGNKDVLFEVIYNGTISGGTFVTNTSGIAMYNITATHCTGGTKLAAAYVTTANRMNTDNIFDKDFWLGGEITGTADTLTVVARSLAGVTTGAVLSSINFKEVY
jgi:hypothetical protein